MALEFHKYLIAAVERGASDVHLKPGAPPMLRLNGRLLPQPDLGTPSAEALDALARTVLSERKFRELRDGREVDASYAIEGVGRFRVNMFLSLGHTRAVLRIIPSAKPSFHALGLPPVVEKLAAERRGLILVTGVTGSGKSTTLAAIIDHINATRPDHIVTIEDPIEFLHEDRQSLVSQREIGQDSASFATALRAALREDPDVILVGEMRDAETMTVALHAAETGHLVLSTLHTLNATETVNRIIGAFPPEQDRQIREQLAAVLRGVISQRLIPRANGQGRVPAVEVLVGTALVRECIREAKRTAELPTVIAAGNTQYGMQTFDQSLLRLYKDEVISLEVARETATSPDDFDLKVRGILTTGEQMAAGPPPTDAPAITSFARPDRPRPR